MQSRKHTDRLQGELSSVLGSEQLADLLAIAGYVDPDWIPDLRGGAAARLLWAAAYVVNGCRPGTIRRSEAELAAMIGADGARSLRGSKGSPGPLDRLEAIGAIEAAAPGRSNGRWYIASPAELAKPRRRSPPRETPPLSGMPPDIDGELPSPPDTPLAIAMQDGGFRPESPAETPDAAHGGRGGIFLGASQEYSQESKKNTPPPPPSIQGASGGFPPESPVPIVRESPVFNPASWRVVHIRLRDEAGVKTPREMCETASAVGLQPADLDGLVQFYVDHPGAWGGPAVILLAIRAMTPGEPAANWNLWPTTNPGYDRGANQAWKEAKRERDRKATRTLEIIRAGKKAQQSEEQIHEQLAAEGLRWEDQD